MANLTVPAPEDATFSADVYRLESTDPVLGHVGGALGVSNSQAARLIENEVFLKKKVDDFGDGSGFGDNSVARVKLKRGVIPVNVPRNSVISGPYDASLRKLLTASGATLSFAAPAKIAFAAGYDQNGPIDYIGLVASGGTVLDVPTTSTIYHIYAKLNSVDGSVQFRGISIPPVYSREAPDTPLNLTFWYDQNEEIMKQWNSGASAWQPQLVVFVGLARKLGDGSWDNITTYEYRRDVNAESSTPAGVIHPYAGSAAPSGWLLCDGIERNIADYPRLYSVIGTTYGGDTEAGVFQVPDLRGRVPVGKDNMGGSAAGRITTAGSGVNGEALGASGGTQSVSLTLAQIPPHTHPVAAEPAQATSSGSNTVARSAGSTTYNSGASGGSGGVVQAHSNIQPLVITNYIIKV